MLCKNRTKLKRNSSQKSKENYQFEVHQISEIQTRYKELSRNYHHHKSDGHMISRKRSGG